MKDDKNGILPHLRKNLGTGERVASVILGSYLTYSAFAYKSVLRGLIGGYMLFRGGTGHCPAYEAMSQREYGKKGRNVNIKTTVTIDRPRHEVYSFWREIENLPLFMEHLSEVRELNEKRSVWTAKLPGNTGTITWESEIVEDQPNERIGWRSIEGSTIENAGNVHFEDAGVSGTEVHAIISYKAPLGTMGEGAAKLMNPLFEEMVKKDILNLKNYLEKKEYSKDHE